jgi:hypothetical protein
VWSSCRCMASLTSVLLVMRGMLVMLYPLLLLPLYPFVIRC